MEDATRIASALQQAILSRRIRAPTFTSDATAFAAGDRQGGFSSSGAAGVQGGREGGSGGGGGSAVSSSKCSRALDVEKCLHLWKQKKSVINRGTDFGKEERWGQRKRARRLQVLEHTNDAADASGGGGVGGGAYEGVEETKSERPIRRRELPDLRKFAVSPSQYFEQQRQQWRKKQSSRGAGKEPMDSGGTCR